YHAVLFCRLLDRVRVCHKNSLMQPSFLRLEPEASRLHNTLLFNGQHELGARSNENVANLSDRALGWPRTIPLPCSWSAEVHPARITKEQECIECSDLDMVQDHLHRGAMV